MAKPQCVVGQRRRLTKVLGAAERAADEWVQNHEDNGGGEAWLVHTGERLVEAEALRCRPDFERLLGTNGQSYLDACRARDERVRQEKEAQLKRIAEERIVRSGSANGLSWRPSMHVLLPKLRNRRDARHCSGRDGWLLHYSGDGGSYLSRGSAMAIS